jgi:hypothetical protein
MSVSAEYSPEKEAVFVRLEDFDPGTTIFSSKHLTDFEFLCLRIYVLPSICKLLTIKQNTDSIVHTVLF